MASKMSFADVKRFVGESDGDPNGFLRLYGPSNGLSPDDSVPRPTVVVIDDGNVDNTEPILRTSVTDLFKVVKSGEVVRIEKPEGDVFHASACAGIAIASSITSDLLGLDSEIVIRLGVTPEMLRVISIYTPGFEAKRVERALLWARGQQDQQKIAMVLLAAQKADTCCLLDEAIIRDALQQIVGDEKRPGILPVLPLGEGGNHSRSAANCKGLVYATIGGDTSNGTSRAVVSVPMRDRWIVLDPRRRFGGPLTDDYGVSFAAAETVGIIGKELTKNQASRKLNGIAMRRRTRRCLNRILQRQWKDNSLDKSIRQQSEHGVASVGNLQFKRKEEMNARSSSELSKRLERMQGIGKKRYSAPRAIPTNLLPIDVPSLSRLAASTQISLPNGTERLISDIEKGRATIPKTLDDLPHQEVLISKLSSKVALSLGFGNISEMDVSSSVLLYVQDYMKFRDVQFEDAKVRYGVGVRWILDVTTYDARAKLDGIPFVAASAQLGHVCAQARFTVKGVSSREIDKAIPSPTALDLDSYVEFTNAFAAIKSLIADADTVNPVPLAIVGTPRGIDDPEHEFHKAMAITWSLTAIRHGQPLREALVRFPNLGPAYGESISAVYANVAKTTELDAIPSQAAVQVAAEMLAGLELEYEDGWMTKWNRKANQ